MCTKTAPELKEPVSPTLFHNVCAKLRPPASAEGSGLFYLTLSILTSMNSFQRIHLHLQCAKQRPSHAWFHAKGVGRELPILIGSIVAAVAAQWIAWHLK